MMVTSIFSFAYYVLYSIREKLHHVIHIVIVVCKIFSIRTMVEFCRLVDVKQGLHQTKNCMFSNKIQLVCLFFIRQFFFAFSNLNPFPNKPWFSRVCSTGLLKTLGKGEIARNEQFLLFPQCFLSFWRTCCHFHQISNCSLQTLSVWKSLKFVVWERVE